MAVILTDNFSAGSSKAGIVLTDLRVDVVNEDGTAALPPQTNGAGSCIITELGRGVYLVTFEHPDGHQGAAKLMQVSGGPAFLASVAINPGGAGGGGGSAAEVAGAVWRFPDRALSEIPTNGNAPSSPGFTRRRGDTWRIRLEYLGDLTGAGEVWFTVKRGTSETDAAALLQVSESAGLVVLNGGAPASAALAVLTVDVAGNAVEVEVDEEATAALPPLLGMYDLQIRQAGNTDTPRSGYFEIAADVTRAIA